MQELSSSTEMSCAGKRTVRCSLCLRGALGQQVVKASSMIGQRRCCPWDVAHTWQIPQWRSVPAHSVCDSATANVMRTVAYLGQVHPQKRQIQLASCCSAVLEHWPAGLVPGHQAVAPVRHLVGSVDATALFAGYLRTSWMAAVDLLSHRHLVRFDKWVLNLAAWIEVEPQLCGPAVSQHLLRCCLAQLYLVSVVQNCLGCFVLGSLALRTALTKCAQLRKPGHGNLYLRKTAASASSRCYDLRAASTGASGSDHLNLIDLQHIGQQGLTCKNLVQIWVLSYGTG